MTFRVCECVFCFVFCCDVFMCVFAVDDFGIGVFLLVVLCCCVFCLVFVLCVCYWLVKCQLANQRFAIVVQCVWLFGEGDFVCV